MLNHFGWLFYMRCYEFILTHWVKLNNNLFPKTVTMESQI